MAGVSPRLEVRDTRGWGESRLETLGLGYLRWGESQAGS